MVKVVWVDAASHGGPGWVDLDDAVEFAQLDPPLMSTVGYVLAHEDDGPEGWIVLTDTLGAEECSSIHKIPNPMIRQITYLESNR